MYKSNGSVLISTIVSLAVVSLIVASLFQVAYSTSKISSSFTKVNSKNNKQLSLTAENLTLENANQDHHCIRGTEQGTSFKLCFGDSLEKEIAASGLFVNSIDCPTNSTQSFATSPSGFRLTSSSYISNKLCEENELSIESDQSYLGNLSIKDLEIESEILLASKGWIDIENLKLNSNLSIIAGGDIHINSIKNASSNYKVKLYSVSGVVSLNKLGENISAIAKAKHGVFGAEVANENIIPRNLRIKRTILSLTKERGSS